MVRDWRWAGARWCRGRGTWFRALKLARFREALSLAKLLSTKQASTIVAAILPINPHAGLHAPDKASTDDRKKMLHRASEFGPEFSALCFNTHDDGGDEVVRVMMMVVTMPPWSDPDSNAGTVMMMMVMTDHNLRGLNGVGFGPAGHRRLLIEAAHWEWDREGHGNC